MDSDQCKMIARRWIVDGYGKGDTAVLYELADATMLEEASIPAQIEAFHEAFPDLAARVEEQMAEGDRVMTRAVFTGTHTGPLLGIPATGRPLEIGFVQLNSIEDGKVTDIWNDFNPVAILAQLGLMEIKE
jgi:predicted ester cyclase